jgi:hypothetical protein
MRLSYEIILPSKYCDEPGTVVILCEMNPPGDEERVTEFYINVGYGGNWSEIPLISGSDLIGVGNRVVIRQPAN